MMIECRTTTDWMMLLAEAINDMDEDKVMQLADISYAWLQPEDEMNAQVALCHSALDMFDNVLEAG